MSMTFAEAAKLAPSKQYKGVIYALIQQDPLFANLPLTWWPGGESVNYKQTMTLPTPAWRGPTDNLSSSSPVRKPFTQILKELYVQDDVPPVAEGALSGEINQRAANWADLATAYGLELRTTLTDGNHMSAAVGATAVTNGLLRVKLGPRYPDTLAGRLYFKYTHATKTLEYKTSAGGTYGTAVDVTSDLHQGVLYDGTDVTHYIYVDFDTSAPTGDWETTSDATGVVLTATKQIDGLMSYIWPTQRVWGNLSATAPGAVTGDAVALAQMAWLRTKVPSSEDDLAYLCSERTMINLMPLLAGSSTTVETWRGTKMKPGLLNYLGIPIFGLPNMPLTEYAGVGATGIGQTCGSIYLVRFNRENGASMYYWNEAGPSARIEDGGEQKRVRLPVYAEDVGPVNHQSPNHFLRIMGSYAFILQNTQMMAEVHGINN